MPTITIIADVQEARLWLEGTNQLLAYAGTDLRAAEPGTDYYERRRLRVAAMEAARNTLADQIRHARTVAA